MFKYNLYYDGGFLRDSADLGYTFETEEEAKAFVDEIKSKHKQARHNCFAYIVKDINRRRSKKI